VGVLGLDDGRSPRSRRAVAVAMSRENVELAWQACEAWIRGNLDAFFERCHPEFEWHTPHFQDWLESKVIRGRDRARQFLEDDWLGSWDSYEASVDDVVDAGGHVLVFWRQRMTGRGSGAPVHFDSAQVWTVQDGLILRIENYTERTEALEVVGLRE
jgi:ketosteroid isomerase-like protein